MRPPKLYSDNPIKFTLTWVTPDVAKDMLTRNDGNRQLRPVTLSKYVRDLRAGKWQLTHQCIAVDSSGNLIDGQHRLTAIVQTGIPIYLYIASYEENGLTASGIICDTQATRSAVDILGCNRKDQETARSLFNAARALSTTPTVSEISHVLNEAGEIISQTTLAAKPVARSFRSSAPVRAAFALQMYRYPNDAKELVNQLKNFTTLEMRSMWPCLADVLKSFENNPRMSQGWYMERVFWATDRPNRNKSVCRLNKNEIRTKIRETALAMCNLSAGAGE